MKLKLKVIANSPQVEVPGLGLVESNTWTDVSEEAQAKFLQVSGKTLEDAHVDGRFEVKKPSSRKKDD